MMDRRTFPGRVRLPRHADDRFSRKAAVSLIVALGWLVSASLAFPSDAGPSLQFDIASQPLAAALRAFSKTTGLEVFYDGSLSIGHSSSAVKGSFAPMLGLKELLRGTGYVARATEMADTVTIVDGPPVTALRASFIRFEPYFAVLQAKLSEALCDNEEPASNDGEVTFRFWIDRTGVIADAEVFGATPSAGWSRTLAKLRGLKVGMGPPPGLPQPLTMVVYPPRAGEARGCAAGETHRASN
jgi:hypothetical protein